MNIWSTEPVFESLFRASPNAIIVLDPAGCVVAVNPACEALACFDSSGLVGREIGDSAGAPLQAFIRDTLKGAAAGKNLKRNLDIFRSDGTVMPASVSSAPLAEDGKIRGHLLSIADATASVEVEYRLRSLFERNPSVVIALDRQFLIEDVNPAGLRISGYGLDELVGRALTDFVPPSRRDEVRAHLERAAAGETLAFPAEAYARSGQILHYEVTALPILSRNAVTGIYVLLENVSERVQDEHTIENQREEITGLEHDFRALFDKNPDGVAALTATGVIERANAAALEIVRRAAHEVIGKSFQHFIPQKEHERITGFFLRALEGETLRYDALAVRGDGAHVDLDVTLLPRYSGGEKAGVYAIFTDVTQRNAARANLERQAERMRELYALATTSDYGDAQVMATLEMGCRLFGLSTGAIVEFGQTLAVDMRFDEREEQAAKDDDILEIAKRAQSLREPVCADPTGLWVASRLTAAGTLHGLLVFVSDRPRVSPFAEIDREMLALMAALIATALERRRTRLHLRALAYYDSLTGLPNRLFFQERLRDALVDMRGRARPAAVLFFDLDHFKDINETLGHAMGDRFLQLVANRLVRSSGENAAVARMGGDEFIVLLLNCSDAEQVRETAEKMLRALDEPYEIDGYEQYISASIGVAIFPRDGRDDQTLIKKADIAMYRAKERGGNGYFFYTDTLEAPIRNRLSQEKLLRRAIAKQEFVLHFQPIVQTQTGRIVSLEALVRWNHAERGLVFPDEFIPTAEATGLILPLGEWVAGQAARDLRGLREQFNDLCVAINLSARQFHQPGLSERLGRAIESAGIDPSWVEMEITETMTLIDASAAIETVRRLKATGIRIAVDDFGTGHSSLNYLRRFEVDYIKIDRSFVAAIGRHASDETIVKAIIAMGHSLGMSIIAEGVETAEQAEFLREHGCDRLQGYLFSAPADLARIRDLLKNGRGTVAPAR